MLGRIGALLALLLPLLAWPSAGKAALATVPADFTDTLVVDVGSPTDLVWTPDGRMLVTQQSGQLRVVANGVLVATPALSLGSSVCTDFERGLLGVEVDPNFAENQRIYLYYTYNKFDYSPNSNCPKKSGSSEVANVPVNRVSRFILNADNTVSMASEVVLLDNIPSPGGNHNAGDLAFGHDGYLYVAIGDGGNDYATGGGYSGSGGANDAARDTHVMLGKIARITTEGGIPADNPFQGANSGRCNQTGSTAPGNHCQETWAWGLRNPFRMAVNPDDGRIFINDVGQNVREEIDEGQAGADYGWNCREGTRINNTSGPCNPTPSGMVPPIFEYNHGFNAGTPFENCNSITGGAFVPAGVWTSAYAGRYMFADYVCGRIFSMVDSGGWQASGFGTDLGAVTTLAFGPDGATQSLYYTRYGPGQVRRIRYTGSGNQAPTASLNADPTSGTAPLSVSFDGAGSSDPEQGPLLYEWTFGDGTATITTTQATTSHSYADDGSYTAILRVRDQAGLYSDPATVEIVVGGGNQAPSIVIDSPAPSALFSVGEDITFSASASDPEDGTLGPEDIELRVILHHDTHTHPFLTVPQTDSIVFSGPAPEDLLAATNSYLELVATATDSVGATSVVTQELRPRTVELDFVTDPAGLEIVINGVVVEGPASVLSWVGYVLSVNAPDQVANGSAWEWASWSDGGDQEHTIVSPAEDTTYTAVFSESVTYQSWLPLLVR